MKRIRPYIWNVLLCLFVAFMAVLVLPKVRGQFTAPRATPDMIAIGYVGIGALVGVVLCAVSAASFFWFQWLMLVGGGCRMQHTA